MAGNDRRKLMANQEHLKILQQGTAVWNEWRAQHPEIRPDLSDAKLTDAKLRDANLSFANLNGATLDTDVSFATLNEPDLHGANLNGATVFYAELSDATLS